MIRINKNKNFQNKNIFSMLVLAASVYFGSAAISSNSYYSMSKNLPNNLPDSLPKEIVMSESESIKGGSASTKSKSADISADIFDKPIMDVSSKSSLDSMIASYACTDKNIFSDNAYYSMLRRHDALLQIQKYLDKNIVYGARDMHGESTILFVNKTFQKAMIVKLENQAYIYSADSINSFTKQGRNFVIAKNQPDKIVETRLEPTILMETDCSTAKVYGPKKFDGDGKTPEGLMKVLSISESYEWTYENKLAYGPVFLRINNSIGVHGNGTDTTKIRNWKTDPRYAPLQPLGIYDNNFGYGLSHGCLRFNNSVIDSLVKNRILCTGTNVIIYENAELTKALSKYYPLHTR